MSDDSKAADPGSIDPDSTDPGSGEPARFLPTVNAIDGFVIGLFVLALLFVLRETREFLLPIVVAVILSLLLDPAVRALEKLRLPRSVATGVLLAAFLALFVGALHLTVEPASEYLAGAPQKLHRLKHRVELLMRPMEGMGEAAQQMSDMTEMSEKNGEDVSVSDEPSLQKSIFVGTQSFLAGAAVTVILTYFFLASGNTLVRRWAGLMGHRRRNLEIVRQIQRDVSGHLWTISLINAGLGVAVGLGCWWVGMPNPVLWGAVAAIFNFVPYLGAAAGVLIVAAVSLLSFDSPWQALQAPAIYAVLTGVEGSFVTPTILGQRFSLHPTIVFVGFLFWTYLWGVAGGLLAVPLLLVIKIVCDNVPKLQKLGKAMASDPASG